MNYYQRHVGDYIRDTAHLTLIEHGIYNRLLDVYYLSESPIPVAQAARLVGARSREERKALDQILADYFTRDGDVWRQKRCDEVIAEYHDFLASQSAKGKASAAARRLNRASTEDQPESNNGSTAVPVRLVPDVNREATGRQPPNSHSPSPTIEDKSKRAKNGLSDPEKAREAPAAIAARRADPSASAALQAIGATAPKVNA